MHPVNLTLTSIANPSGGQNEPGPPLVCSVVLTYNNFVDTAECLESLATQNYPRHSTILVDNGSSDDSVSRLMERWPDIEIVRTGENLGVAGGYNAGIRAALNAGAAYVVTCNNDIVADAEFVSSLVEVFESRPEAAIVVPIILYYDSPERVWSSGIRQHPVVFYSRNLFRGQALSRVREARSAPFESDYVPTCASMISRRALESVGLLDERFFFGHDDVDWCLRARKSGFRCLVLPEPLVRHKVSVTSGVRGSNTLSPSSAYTHATGSVLIGAKHFKGASGVGFLVGLLLLRVPYNVASMALSGAWPSTARYLAGIASGFRRYGALFWRPVEASDARSGLTG